MSREVLRLLRLPLLALFAFIAAPSLRSWDAIADVSMIGERAHDAAQASSPATLTDRDILSSFSAAPIKNVSGYLSGTGQRAELVDKNPYSLNAPAAADSCPTSNFQYETIPGFRIDKKSTFTRDQGGTNWCEAYAGADFICTIINQNHLWPQNAIYGGGCSVLDLALQTVRRQRQWHRFEVVI